MPNSTYNLYHSMGRNNNRIEELDSVTVINRSLRESSDIWKLFIASQQIEFFKSKFPGSKYIWPMLYDLSNKLQQLIN